MTKTVIIPFDVHVLIVKKQMEIREKYGVTLRISDMVSVGMRDVIDSIEKLFNIGRYNIITESAKTKKMKTVIIPDDVHTLIVKKQIEIKEKYRITLRITDMTAVGMRSVIDRIEKLFNLGSSNIGDGVMIEPIKIQGGELKVAEKEEIRG